jgi:6-pyruvoyltetrahydropterin/6-carboxytetrahydropterin synthase
MSLSKLTAASGRFSAARRLDGLPPDHPAGRRHGHNFHARVEAALPAGWAAFAGGEVAALQSRLADCLAPLDFSDLNERLPTPDDAGLARWIAANLGTPGLVRVALQSRHEQGVGLDAGGAARVWRRYAFQAAHRLPNVAPGHKCGRLHGHGFEVLLQARLQVPGEAPEQACARLDAAWAPCLERLDHACLNDIAGLENPTSEMLSAWLWQRLRAELPQLAAVTVFETASCGASHDGADYRIWKDFFLDSAVRLQRAPAGHRLAGVHGHSFRLRLHLRAPLDRVLGWTMDFGDVKTLFDPVFDALDHRPLHELAGLDDADTGSLAAWAFERVRRELPALAGIELEQTPGCGAIVSADPGLPELPG